VSVPITVFEVLHEEPFETGMPVPGNVEVHVLVGPQTYRIGIVVVVLKKPWPDVQVAGFELPLGRFPTLTVHVFVGPQMYMIGFVVEVLMNSCPVVQVAGLEFPLGMLALDGAACDQVFVAVQ